MKRVFVVIAISFALLSCQFSKGVKKDLSTGLSASYNGFALDEIYLAAENGERLNSNKIPLGSTVVIVATGVDFYSEKDGKVFPGCRIILTDKNKKELLNLPDAFHEMTEGTPASQASTLRAELNTGEPMIAGEIYHLNVRFFDKNRQQNQILADVDLVMTQ